MGSKSPAVVLNSWGLDCFRHMRGYVSRPNSLCQRPELVGAWAVKWIAEPPVLLLPLKIPMAAQPSSCMGSVLFSSFPPLRRARLP